MIVYHGTTMKIQDPDIRHSKANLDFGVGFYTTSYPKQAERWAMRKGLRLSKQGIVNIYEIGSFDGFRVRRFHDTDREWLHFVVDCRNGKDVYRGYDVVIGNVADDDVFKCVGLFMNGIWDEERTIRELRYFRKNDQIVFLTQEIIDAAVRFKDSYEVI